MPVLFSQISFFGKLYQYTQLGMVSEHDLTQGTPCPRCGYDLYQHRLGSLSCLRCYPTRDYHIYSEQLDRLHPWKRQSIKEW